MTLDKIIRNTSVSTAIIDYTYLGKIVLNIMATSHPDFRKAGLLTKILV